ncbi:hypothetical protein CEXT_504961 [Caerostris extrusa]|uniref:Uncharacterized protein n=1 Tax=Caerostris extrusa TaxID=172846 RepID=A0AAV4PHE5_CAEEX|nr:hypothetical protein CEXT_504961 [Caerostris extrusa]
MGATEKVNPHRRKIQKTSVCMCTIVSDVLVVRDQKYLEISAVEGRILTGRMMLRVAGDCQRLISPLARRLLFLRTDAIDDFVRNRQPPNDIPRAESSARNPYGTRAPGGNHVYRTTPMCHSMKRENLRTEIWRRGLHFLPPFHEANEKNFQLSIQQALYRNFSFDFTFQISNQLPQFGNSIHPNPDVPSFILSFSQ